MYDTNIKRYKSEKKSGRDNMAYSELIKNFDQIRSYIRDFYIYGFKTREEYNKKSARSYDNERRRIQSYLGELVSFCQTETGKKIFISLEGRKITHNPLYRAFKSKSFTSKDITLHFFILDILADGNRYTLKELLEIIDEEYLSMFENPISFDESTLRKKLKEYEQIGLITMIKEGRVVYYKKEEDRVELEKYREAIRFFSEENILGVIGSYLEDRMEEQEEDLVFKNHYIMNIYDAEILENILAGIQEKRAIEISNFSIKSQKEKIWNVIPLKVYVSTQGGRNYLLCSNLEGTRITSFRIDYIQKVKVKEKSKFFQKALESYQEKAIHMWGVNCAKQGELEHIEMDIHVEPDEKFIVRRLEREKRCGKVTQIDDKTYRFSADVFDSYEIVPWIRTFFGRIQSLKGTNERVIWQIRTDIMELAKEYEV